MPLRLTSVGPGLHRLASVYTNWYLLEEGGRLTVLDAGLPRDWQAFGSALGRMGYSLGDIDAVLVTHHHPDHFGNAERLRESGARVFTHSAEAPFLRGEETLDNRNLWRYLWRPWYAAYMLGYLRKGILRTPPVAQLNELEDGETLDVPGSPRVIHAPGHTAGSCAIFLEAQSALLSGDALVTLDVAKGPRGRRGPQVVRGPHSGDIQEAISSLDALAATNARVVLPGHGEPWTRGVKSAVDFARRT